MFGEKRGAKHIAGLDALRALAIILITLFHVFPDVFAGGYIGVCLFLVITGFLLAYSAFSDAGAENFNIFSYFFKRVKRLYPPLLFVILITVGLYHYLLPGALDDCGKEIVSILLGFNNWWQLEMNSDYFARVVNASPFTHMWFLGVELEYVLIWPLLFYLCLLLKKKASVALFLLGLASAGWMAYLALNGTDIQRLYYGTDTRVSACLLGGAVGLWFVEKKNGLFGGKLLPISSPIVFAILLIPALVATFLLKGQYMLLYTGGALVLTLIFCLMLITVIEDSYFGEKLDCSVFKWIGSHSYEIFLWQYPVLVLFQKKAWHDLPYGPALEIALILFLSWCSKWVVDSLFSPKTLFRGEGFKWYAKLYIFAWIAICSAMTMYVGAGVVLASDFNPDHKPGYKLKLELEQRQAELAKAQAEHAKQEAERAKKLKEAEDKKALRLRGNGVTMIGDSVMLGASPGIEEVMPDAYVDAEGCRQVMGGLEVAQKLSQEGKLGDIVVIALGTNGPLAEYEPNATATQNLLNVIGPNRQVFWVTNYCSYSQWMLLNNKFLAEYEQSHPNFHVIDWYPLAKSHPEWLQPDGTHLNLDGRAQYSKLIQDTMAQKLPLEQKS